MMSAEERLRKLSDLYVGGVQNSNGQALSVETLLDVLIVLYDECCNSTLRREKNISEFVDFGKGEIFIHQQSGVGSVQPCSQEPDDAFNVIVSFESFEMYNKSRIK